MNRISQEDWFNIHWWIPSLENCQSLKFLVLQHINNFVETTGNDLFIKMFI